jgi:hypothetical protein
MEVMPTSAKPGQMWGTVKIEIGEVGRRPFALIEGHRRGETCDAGHQPDQTISDFRFLISD